jgi:ankyrin repeat protein
MTAEEGASAGEQIIEAARRNNVELLLEVFEAQENSTAIAKLINESRDPLGNTALHLASITGSFEVLDHLLDQELVEVDPLNRLQQDTPLHSAVRYSLEEPEHGAFLVETLIEAGADPRIRNKNKQKPVDIASPGNTKLIETLRSAEFAMMLGPGK